MKKVIKTIALFTCLSIMWILSVPLLIVSLGIGAVPVIDLHFRIIENFEKI